MEETVRGEGIRIAHECAPVLGEGFVEAAVGFQGFSEGLQPFLEG
jgi:hypothetical protein